VRDLATQIDEKVEQIKQVHDLATQIDGKVVKQNKIN
jgi:glycine cleavage system H lipoate-binding protein